MSSAPTSKKNRVEWQPTLARRLKQARAERGLTQDDIAAMLTPKLTKSSISQWEKSGEDGTVPSPDYLRQIAPVLGVSVDWLLGIGPDELPALVAQAPVDRSVIGQALLAVEVFLAARPSRRLPPEDKLALIFAVCDWAEIKQRDQRTPIGAAEMTAYIEGRLEAARPH